MSGRSWPPRFYAFVHLYIADVTPFTANQMKPLRSKDPRLSTSNLPALTISRYFSFSCQSYLFMFYSPICTGGRVQNDTCDKTAAPRLLYLSVYERTETLWTSSLLSYCIFLTGSKTWCLVSKMFSISPYRFFFTTVFMEENALRPHTMWHFELL